MKVWFGIIYTKGLKLKPDGECRIYATHKQYKHD